MADAVDYSQMTSAINSLTASSTALANTFSSSFGAGLTASIESAFQKISNSKKALYVRDEYLSGSVFNGDWKRREIAKVDTLKQVRDMLQSANLQALGTSLNEGLKNINQTISSVSQNPANNIGEALNQSLTALNDSIKKLGDSLNPGGNNGGQNGPSPGTQRTLNDAEFRKKTVDFYDSTLKYLDAIASHTKLNSSVAQMGSLLGEKLGSMFGGGRFGNAFGHMLGDAMSNKLQDILTRIFNGESISKILFGILKGTVGRLLGTVFAPIKHIWNGVKGALGFADKALLKFSEIVFGASAKVKDFFEKVTPLKMLLGIIPEAVTAITDFINMIVMFPLNKIKETQQLAYSTMDSLTGKINDVMATYGVSQDQAMRMIFQQEVMLKQMPYIYRDSFKVQADITEQYRSLLKATGMTVQQAQSLAPVLDKFKHSILEGIDLAGSTLVKLGSKLHGDLDRVVDSYGSALIKLQNSMNINASQVNQQFQDNFAEYFELTSYNSDELIDKSTSMIKVLAELNSTVVDSNKLLQNIAANRDKLSSEFFSTDFGRSVLHTSSNPRLAKMWLDSRSAEGLQQFYEDRFEGIRRRFAGFTPETLNTEFAISKARAIGVDLDEVRQVLKQGATAQTFQKFSEEKKADRWEEVLKTLAQDYHREWDKGHVFIGPDSEKLLRMGETWGEEKFVKEWQDAINGKCILGVNFDSARNAQMMLTVLDDFFGPKFTDKLLMFMGTSVKLANDFFGAFVHFSNATIKFIGHFAAGGFDVFNPETQAYQSMVKDVLPSVAMGLTATSKAASHGSEAVRLYGDLLGDTITTMGEKAASLGKKYDVDPSRFVSDRRLLQLTKDTKDALTMYALEGDQYVGDNPWIKTEYTARLSKLQASAATGPKAVLFEIKDQLVSIIAQGIRQAIPGGQAISKLSKAASSDSILSTISPAYWALKNWKKVAENPLMGVYGMSYPLRAMDIPDHPYSAPPIATQHPESLQELYEGDRFAWIHRDELRQMLRGSSLEYFSTSASQIPNSSDQLADSFKSQQGQQTVKNQTEDINEQSVVNTANFIKVTHTFRDKVMEELANETDALTEGFDVLEETSVSSAKYLLDIRDTLVQLAAPGVTHFNKFNNNLSTKLNSYLEGMIGFIKAEQKLQEEQKNEAKKSNEDAIGGGEFRGFQGGSVFSYTPSGFYREPRGNHLHNGVDFPAPGGTPLPATEDSVVADLEHNPAKGGGYGKLVFLKGLKSGMYIGYAHLSEVDVNRIGEKVSAGQMIGRVGNTGHSFGDHLHFMVGTNVSFPAKDIDSTINPLDYLKGKNIKPIKGMPRGKRGVGVLSRMPGFGWLGGRNSLDSMIADIVSLVANSESAGRIDAVRDAADRGYGKYQFTTLPGSFDNWGRFVSWLGKRSEFAVLYEKLKNTNGADASSVRPAIQELAKTHHALFEKAQDLHAIEHWLAPLGQEVNSRSKPFRAAAFSFSIHRSPQAALDILKKSGALGAADDRQALIKLYKYAYAHFGDFAGRYDKETQMLGIYDDIKISNPKGGGFGRIAGGILDNAASPFTSVESGINLLSSALSGTAFDGIRPFLAGPMYSGSWQTDDRYNINQSADTISEAGVNQQHIADYLSIWGSGKGSSAIFGSESSSFGGYAQEKFSSGDNTLYSMGWVADLGYHNRHPEFIDADPAKFGLTRASDIVGAGSFIEGMPTGRLQYDGKKTWGVPKLGEGLSLEKRGNAMVVVKTPPPPTAPPATQNGGSNLGMTKIIQNQEKIIDQNKQQIQNSKEQTNNAKKQTDLEERRVRLEEEKFTAWKAQNTSILGELHADLGYATPEARQYRRQINEYNIKNLGR